MEGWSKVGEWKGWREGVRWEEERESEGQEEVSVHVFFLGGEDEDEAQDATDIYMYIATSPTMSYTRAQQQ